MNMGEGASRMRHSTANPQQSAQRCACNLQNRISTCFRYGELVEFQKPSHRSEHVPRVELSELEAGALTGSESEDVILPTCPRIGHIWQSSLITLYQECLKKLR